MLWKRKKGILKFKVKHMLSSFFILKRCRKKPLKMFYSVSFYHLRGRSLLTPFLLFQSQGWRCKNLFLSLPLIVNCLALTTYSSPFSLSHTHTYSLTHYCILWKPLNWRVSSLRCYIRHQIAKTLGTKVEKPHH